MKKKDTTKKVEREQWNGRKYMQNMYLIRDLYSECIITFNSIIYNIKNKTQ